MRLALRLVAMRIAGFRGQRLTGMCRFLLYICLQFGVFLFTGLCLALHGALILYLGARDGLSWFVWARRSWPVVMMALLPAVVGFPLTLALGAVTSGRTTTGFLLVWAPPLTQSARFLMVFASAAWLSRGMSPVELRDVLAVLLKPLGRRLGGGVARSAALAMAFLPWTITEVRHADEAARLRGSNPGRFPARHLAAMAVPVSVRALEKARLSAEALELRDPGSPFDVPQAGEGD
ncbi:MAG: hypothetical protein ABIJ86_09620 [Spirochaetota bacterium]